ncbi:uncharacterized protein H6S33_010215 [Morchella sextelata]|uniref:uncharacterized protein n=1 Tax=Morchella sextelata TaxID=1174677 RepID=UPI001D03A2E8|nr:uncharacterized protein H6S33_010215 [Morchella sextelata]KAH0612163.1 hypothetical protein H6S33_010215 [Morchella sextelata]
MAPVHSDDMGEKPPPTSRPASDYTESVISSSSISESTPHAEGEEQTEAPVARTVTGKSSIVIPRNKRRGMLGRFGLVAEIENPKDYGTGTKNFITILVAAGGAAAPMASTILFPALTEISEKLHSTQSLTNLSVALYMLAMAICPLWWSALSERSGRRTVYIISFALFTIFGVCSAVSVNIGMLIAFRVLSGASASSMQAVGAGTISDIWDVKERGRAMGWFYLGPLCGPLFSPVIGGALTGRFGWRSTQWFLAIYGVVLWFMMLFGLPETLRKKPVPKVSLEKEGDNVLERSVSRVSIKKAKEWTVTARHIFIDPLKSLRYLKFPPVLLTVFYASMTFTCLYVLNISIQTTFSKSPYNFHVIIVGLLYIPPSLGYVAGSQVGGRWSDTIMKRAAHKRRAAASLESGIPEDAPLEYRPEDRMGINVLIAGMLYPCAILYYGWMVNQGYYWLAPMVGTTFFGFGSMLVFGASTTMLTEFVPGRSSSAVAVNNFIRNICACIGGVVAEPLIVAIGNGWLFTILSLAGLCSLSTVWIMRKFGPKWRAEVHKYNLN